MPSTATMLQFITLWDVVIFAACTVVVCIIVWVLDTNAFRANFVQLLVTFTSVFAGAYLAISLTEAARDNDNRDVAAKIVTEAYHAADYGVTHYTKILQESDKAGNEDVLRLGFYDHILDGEKAAPFTSGFLLVEIIYLQQLESKLSSTKSSDPSFLPTLVRYAASLGRVRQQLCWEAHELAAGHAVNAADEPGYATVEKKLVDANGSKEGPKCLIPTDSAQLLEKLWIEKHADGIN